MKYGIRMYSSCNYKCKAPVYLFSPFMASLFVGSIFSLINKEYISDELLYVKRQNEEIIERLKNLDKK